MKIFLGLIFLFWFFRGWDLILGSYFFIPFLNKELGDTPPPAWPKVSIIFAAKEEEKRIKAATLSMLSQDYPDYEVIAVNDRSTDRTAQELQSIADPRLQVKTITSLPKGWLGKTHALYEGSRLATGEWILFTDADVLMAPDTLKKSIMACQHHGLDHLALFPQIELEQFVEAMFTHYFMIAFNFLFRPWMARFKHSRHYVGIGAFNFIRREVYEKIGAHTKIAMEVADDMKFGKLVKRSGFRQMAIFGNELVRVRWVEGWGGVLKSLHKNAFSGVQYNVLYLFLSSIGLFCTDVLPFAGLFLTQGLSFYFSAGSVAMIFLIYLS